MKTAEKYLLGAGFLILPFIFSTSSVEQMREPKAHFFAVIVGLALSFELARKISWALGCGAGLVYIGALRVGTFPGLDLLAFSAAMGSCLFIVQADENDIKRGLEVLECAGILAAAYGMLLQFKGIDPILKVFEGQEFRVSVFFGQHTLYGPFCVACAAPALFRGRYFRTLLLLSPVPFIDASFTYLAAGALLALYAVFRLGRPAILALLLLGTAGGVWMVPKMILGPRVDIEALNDNGRYALWGLTWRLIKAHPVIGRGTSSFSQQFPNFQLKELRQAAGVNDSSLSKEAQEFVKRAGELRQQSGIFLHPHNEFLSVFYEFGLVGLLVVAWLLFTFWMGFVVVGPGVESCTLLAIVIIFLANSLGNFPFHLIPQALIPLWAFTAMTSLTRRRILPL